MHFDERTIAMHYVMFTLETNISYHEWPTNIRDQVGLNKSREVFASSFLDREFSVYRAILQISPTPLCAVATLRWEIQNVIFNKIIHTRF